jgi:hypothetical protein
MNRPYNTLPSRSRRSVERSVKLVLRALQKDDDCCELEYAGGKRVTGVDVAVSDSRSQAAGRGLLCEVAEQLYTSAKGRGSGFVTVR